MDKYKVTYNGRNSKTITMSLTERQAEEQIKRQNKTKNPYIIIKKIEVINNERTNKKT